MKLKLDSSKFNEGLNYLKKDYKIFAPVLIPFKGTFSDTDVIRYKEVKYCFILLKKSLRKAI